MPNTEYHVGRHMLCGHAFRRIAYMLDLMVGNNMWACNISSGKCCYDMLDVCWLWCRLRHPGRSICSHDGNIGNAVASTAEHCIDDNVIMK